MITIQNKIVHVEFAKTQSQGSIAVGCKKATLILQQTEKEIKVGEILNPDEIKDLPKIELQFHTTHSVDVVIAYLEEIKKRLTPPPLPDNHLSLAC